MADKGRVCVTVGTGFLGSWLVKRLLGDGYCVNITIRMDPESKRDISYLTNLPGASESLQIFNADLDNPESFASAIKGCIGVFHMAHPLDFEEKESEETKTKRVTNAIQIILQVCVDSKTVKRVIYTSSIAAAAFSGSQQIDESCWTNVDLARRFWTSGAHYSITKTLTGKAAFDFAEKHGLDLVTVLPTWISGPSICPRVPDTVQIALSLILGEEKHYRQLKNTSFVHVNDVARAHIHLFEHPNAKGKYLCIAVRFSIHELIEFISTRYPQYDFPNVDYLKDSTPREEFSISTNKLQETRFKYENGLEEMYDEAIQCCKEKGVSLCCERMLGEAHY